MIKTLYPIFQHWSEKGSVYIISDTHFDDEDCKLMDKGWLTSEQHIENINRFVHKNDTLIHLGDVGNVEWVKKLNGYKVLIMGNHDIGKSNYERMIKFKQDFLTFDGVKSAKQTGDISKFIWNPNLDIYEGYIDNKLFDEVYDGPLMIAEKIILSHEPLDIDWAWNIHGHNHNSDSEDIYHTNLASNIADYEPLNLGKAIKTGVLKQINSIHRQTINEATKRGSK